MNGRKSLRYNLKFVRETILYSTSLLSEDAIIDPLYDIYFSGLSSVAHSSTVPLLLLNKLHQNILQILNLSLQRPHLKRR